MRWDNRWGGSIAVKKDDQGAGMTRHEFFHDRHMVLFQLANLQHMPLDHPVQPVNPLNGRNLRNQTATQISRIYRRWPLQKIKQDWQ